MNKLLAGLMTVIILATVVMVFGLGALSLTGGMESPIPRLPAPSEREQLLTYGTNFDDWKYMSPNSTTQWRPDIADDGNHYIRLRQVISKQVLVYGFEWEQQIVARAFWRETCDPGTPTTEIVIGASDDHAFACIADLDGTTWLTVKTLLPGPIRWRGDFGKFSIDVDLSTWEWEDAQALPPAHKPSL
ncbi:MAG: hypothetical protein P8M73_07130 [Luminiphilus sp.]|jgi:hypothetical protein|nr:hypothetical protein [Luminiphilus sp.]